MPRTFGETLGAIQSVIAYMQDPKNQSALAEKNFDVAPHLSRLQGKLANINQLNAEQEQLKVAQKNKTKALVAATRDGWTDASGLVDAMMGLPGKNTAQARNLQTIRSRLRRTKAGKSAPPTPPAS